MAALRLVLRALGVVRALRLLPDVGERAGPYLVEVATAVRTLLHRSRVGRLALRLYRLAMGVLLGGALLIVAIAMAIVALGRSWPALILALLVAALAAPLLWWWWGWSRGLRLLDRYADRSRELPVPELHARLVGLAREGEGLEGAGAEVARRLARRAAAAAPEE